jgi:hypothetical protein
MAAAVSVTPTSGTGEMTVVRVDFTGLADTAFDQYNPAAVPAEPPITYYGLVSKSGTAILKSHTFTPSQDGKHSWFDIVLPSAGTYAFSVATTSGDQTQASTTFVAS